MPSYDEEWLACVSVTRDPSRSTPPPLLMRLRHVGADLLAEEAAELDLSDHRAGERAGQLDGVADVVGVAVRDEDRIDALRLELARRGRTGFPVRNGST